MSVLDRNDRVVAVDTQYGTVYGCIEKRCLKKSRQGIRIGILHAHSKRPYLIWQNPDMDMPSGRESRQGEPKAA